MKVALDISSIFDEGQAHVMLSRVEEFKQIYILDKLLEKKIYASTKALKEVNEMNKRSINQNPIPWNRQSENLIKISSLNCMNLSNNFVDIINDPTLMQSSILALSETWLDEKNKLYIDGFKEHFNSVGPGKGLAIYIRDEAFQPTRQIQKENMQVSKLESKDLEIIIVYRSSQGNSTELLQHIKDNIKEDISTVIAGDFNICFNTHRNNKISKFLETNGFIQLVKEATHIKGRHIDHMYFKPGKKIQENPSILRYSPYYSDHDAICITLSRFNQKQQPSSEEMQLGK